MSALPNFVSSGAAPRAAQDSLTVKLTRGLSKVKSRSRLGRIYASDGGHCERSATLLSTVEASTERSSALMAYASLGNSIEDLVLSALDDGKTILFKQYHLPDVGLNLGGYVDALIVHNGRVRVLEIKSCGAVPRVPKPLHAAQAAIYSAVTGFPATVFYFSRNVATFQGDLLTAQFDLPENGDLQRTALWRVAYAHLAAKAGVTPNIPWHLSKPSDCGFCPFIQHCWEGVAIPESWPAPVDPSQHLELSRQATEMVDHLLDPEVVAKRRAGVLNYVINLTGNEPAAVALRHTSWAPLLGEVPKQVDPDPSLATLTSD